MPLRPFQRNLSDVRFRRSVVVSPGSSRGRSQDLPENREYEDGRLGEIFVDMHMKALRSEV